jgi:hypothetical protein
MVMESNLPQPAKCRTLVVDRGGPFFALLVEFLENSSEIWSAFSQEGDVGIS